MSDFIGFDERFMSFVFFKGVIHGCRKQRDNGEKGRRVRERNGKMTSCIILLKRVKGGEKL